VKQGILARSAIVAAAIIALAGCDSFRSSLGLDRHVPDETQVVARPPLTLPPDYSLRPPGTPTAASGDHESGVSLGQAPGTQGEQALERSAGAGGPGGAPKEEKGFFGRLFSGEIFGGGEPEDPNQIWRPGQQPAASTTAAATPPADTQPAPANPAPANSAVTAPPADAQPTPPASSSQPASDDNKPGFFGRLFGSIFGD
jgi:hypothetical protein